MPSFAGEEKLIIAFQYMGQKLFVMVCLKPDMCVQSLMPLLSCLAICLVGCDLSPDT